MAHSIKNIFVSIRRPALRTLFIAIFLLQAGCAVTSDVDEKQSTRVATGRWLPGKIVWHDLLTDDVKGATEFYGKMFGWSFEQRERVTTVRIGSRSIGSIIEIDEPAESRHAARWIGSVSVENVDKSVKLLTDQGGVVHEGPHNLPNRGRVAFVSDPHGAQLVLIRAKSGDLDDQPAELNDWLWDELWTNDPRDSIRIYEELVGYSSVEESDGYWVLVSADRWRAGIRDLFDESLKQRWVPVVRVINSRETAALASSLGGRVVVEVGESPGDDTVALLADPAGALFMVQEWENSNQAETDGAQ